MTVDQELSDRFRQIGRILRKGKPNCCTNKSNKISGNKFHHHREVILIILSDNGNCMKQKDLADIMKISPSTLSEMLNKLESDNYIVRNNDPSDRRSTLLSLTDEGLSRLNDMRAEHEAETKYIFRNLEDEEKIELIKLIDKILCSDKEN